MPKIQTEQHVMDFAQARASASEIEEWRRKLVAAEGELERLKEVLKESVPYKNVETAKERVKELTTRIGEASAHLTDSLANADK